MLNCVSVNNMRNSDAYTISRFVPSLVLMQRAAFGVFKAVNWHGVIAIVTGSGNNGGDGFALACILRSHGFACSIYTMTEALSPDSAYYAKKAKEAQIPIFPFHDGCLQGCDIVVDCLLGTGFHGSLRDPYRMAIAQINKSCAFVVSVDINSGMNGDTGKADLAVCSDLTVTIGYVKTGLVMPNAGKYMKRLVCADIGIVLLKEEGKICSSEESIPGCTHCPNWLDMQIISAIE